MQLSRHTSASVGMALVGIALAIEAQACLCTERLTLMEQKAKYSTVVLATVLDVQSEKEGTQSVTLEPIAFWKGTPARKLVVSGGGTSCGYWFKKGEVNLIFANLKKPGSGVGKCSGSTRFSSALTSIRELGNPEVDYSPVLPSSINGLKIEFQSTEWKKYKSGSLGLKFINDSNRPIRLPEWNRFARELEVVSMNGGEVWRIFGGLVPKASPPRTLLAGKSTEVEFVGWSSPESIRPKRVRPFSDIFRESGEFESRVTISVIPDPLSPGEWSGHLVSNVAKLKILEEAP